MGCDIHIYPERLEQGKWVPAEPFKPSEWWWERIVDENSTEDSYDELVEKYENMSLDEAVKKFGDDPRFIWDGPWDDNYDLRGRNYDWFSILADVRNGYGFAGVDTGDGFKPIDEPRGLPDNVSPEVKTESDRWDCDGHSHSWVTLRELLEYDWDGQYTYHRGVVDMENFKRFLVDGKPYLWSGSAHGGNIVHISNKEMRNLCLGMVDGYDTSMMSYHTKVEWKESYRESVGKKYLQDIFDKLSEYGTPDEVRIVFWFDN